MADEFKAALVQTCTGCDVDQNIATIGGDDPRGCR